jgi:hypothetical protein
VPLIGHSTHNQLTSLGYKPKKGAKISFHSNQYVQNSDCLMMGNVVCTLAQSLNENSGQGQAAPKECPTTPTVVPSRKASSVMVGLCNSLVPTCAQQWQTEMLTAMLHANRGSMQQQTQPPARCVNLSVAIRDSGWTGFFSVFWTNVPIAILLKL